MGHFLKKLNRDNSQQYKSSYNAHDHIESQIGHKIGLPIRLHEDKYDFDWKYSEGQYCKTLGNASVNTRFLRI